MYVCTTDTEAFAPESINILETSAEPGKKQRYIHTPNGKHKNLSKWKLKLIDLIRSAGNAMSSELANSLN